MNRQKQDISDELKDIDRKLAGLIEKRARLLSRVSRVRQEKNKSFTDPDLEKQLWMVWKNQLKSTNQSQIRRLFTLLNSLAYARAEKSGPDRPFCLYPPGRPVNLDIPAPGSVLWSLWTVFLGLFSGKSFHIKNFPINDNIIEMIKIGNQCGGSLTWNEQGLWGQPASALETDGKSLFIQNSLTVFYLFICLALGSPGRMKFNASAALKTIDLKDLQHFLPQLGARLTSIEPGSFSLPARLETGAPLPAEIYIPGSMDARFVQALILASPTFEKPMIIDYSGLDASLFSELFQLMRMTGLNPEVQGSRVKTVPGSPDMENVNLPADPLLCGFLLGMAGLSRGRVRLQGSWPSESPLAVQILQILEMCSVQVLVEKDRITATRTSRPQGSFYDLSEHTDLLPLALPLALAFTPAGQATEYIMMPDCPHREIFVDLLNHIGYQYQDDPQGGRLRVLGRQKKSDPAEPWVSPDPLWIPGYALLSFKDKGICLANPGDITSVWPGFWKIFTNLSGADAKPQPEKGETHDRPVRRRIRV
ncbi:MAG: chorismate mutase [Desulfonatronovibrionaceae bacterium]